MKLLKLADVPFKHPLELFLALQYAAGPALSAVPLSLEIRIDTVQRTWSTLLNELTRVKARARNAVDRLTLDDDTCHVVIEELPLEDLKQSRVELKIELVY